MEPTNWKLLNGKMLRKALSTIATMTLVLKSSEMNGEEIASLIFKDQLTKRRIKLEYSGYTPRVYEEITGNTRVEARYKMEMGPSEQIRGNGIIENMDQPDKNKILAAVAHNVMSRLRRRLADMLPGESSAWMAKHLASSEKIFALYWNVDKGSILNDNMADEATFTLEELQDAELATKTNRKEEIEEEPF